MKLKIGNEIRARVCVYECALAHASTCLCFANTAYCYLLYMRMPAEIEIMGI